MKFKHQGKEYDMPVKKFKDQKSYDKALDKKKAKEEKHKSVQKSFDSMMGVKRNDKGGINFGF